VQAHESGCYQNLGFATTGSNAATPAGGRIDEPTLEPAAHRYFPTSPKRILHLRRIVVTWPRPVIDFVGRTASETTADRRERLLDLPPSAKLVFKILEFEAGLTQQEIAERTRLSTRTTRHALAMLKDDELVEEEVYIPDARKRVYTPKPVTVEEMEEPAAEE